jgi:hypothetical protein
MSTDHLRRPVRQGPGGALAAVPGVAGVSRRVKAGPYLRLSNPRSHHGRRPAEDLGVRAEVIRGPWGQPERIKHATLGLTWRVLQVIETWDRPEDSPAGEGRPVLLRREVVLVDGPRPGRPGESGRFILEVCSYGHVPGEWVTALD